MTSPPVGHTAAVSPPISPQALFFGWPGQWNRANTARTNKGERVIPIQVQRSRPETEVRRATPQRQREDFSDRSQPAQSPSLRLLSQIHGGENDEETEGKKDIKIEFD